jgi:hypothetical protein
MGISLVTFNDKTVTPQDDALVYEVAAGKSGLIYGGVVTLSSANVLHITGGHGIIAGRKFTIEAADISVQLTSSGTLKGRLYVHLDLSNQANPISLMIERAASLTPPVQTPNVNISNGVYEFNIAEFTIGTATLSNLKNVAQTFHATSKVLTAGQTTVTFDVPVYGDYLIDFYTSTGISYININTSVSGQVTLTFEEQETNVTIYCEIKEV